MKVVEEVMLSGLEPRVKEKVLAGMEPVLLVIVCCEFKLEVYLLPLTIMVEPLTSPR